MSGAGRPVSGRHATAVRLAKGSAADLGPVLARTAPRRSRSDPGGQNRDLEGHNLTVRLIDRRRTADRLRGADRLDADNVTTFAVFGAAVDPTGTCRSATPT